MREDASAASTLLERRTNGRRRLRRRLRWQEARLRRRLPWFAPFPLHLNSSELEHMDGSVDSRELNRQKTGVDVSMEDLGEEEPLEDLDEGGPCLVSQGPPFMHRLQSGFLPLSVVITLPRDSPRPSETLALSSVSAIPGWTFSFPRLRGVQWAR